MNNRTEQLPSGRRGIGEGRTIVMTTPWSLWAELRSADILGRRILGWEVDRQNRAAYIILEREAAQPVPLLHLVDADDYNGTWVRRLQALMRVCPDSPAAAGRRTATAIEKLAAFFSGRRNQGTALVQEGGAR